jgi:hypothetical protein
MAHALCSLQVDTTDDYHVPQLGVLNLGAQAVAAIAGFIYLIIRVVFAWVFAFLL